MPPLSVTLIVRVTELLLLQRSVAVHVRTIWYSAGQMPGMVTVLKVTVIWLAEEQLSVTVGSL